MDAQVRFSARLEAMTFQMAQFVDLELGKRKEELAAIASKMVEAFDFQKEIRQAFEAQARSRIHDALRVKCGDAAHELMQDLEITITIKSKSNQGAGE